jgi:hypothetical protein
MVDLGQNYNYIAFLSALEVLPLSQKECNSSTVLCFSILGLTNYR